MSDPSAILAGVAEIVEIGKGTLAEVALPVPLRQTFHYRVPEAVRGRVGPGVRVRVPFGARRLVGICVALRAAHEAGDVPAAKMRDIEKVLDAGRPALDGRLLALGGWIADYYRCSLGEALATVLPGGVKRRGTGPSPRPPRGLAQGERNLSAEGPRRPSEAPEGPGRRTPDLVLTDGQRRAVDLISGLVTARRFRPVLVHGITGSGKTEVYLRAIERTIALGRSALVLVPEIALTPQTVARFTARLGRVGVLHSLQGDAERARQWAAARAGEVRVVVGPRSAVFAPLPDVGLIVVDEEHESSFKQETAPRYHARSVALVRARLEDAVCVLGSATPSAETYEHARSGRYEAVYLEERATRASLPDVEVVDLRAEAREVKGFPIITRRLERVLGDALGRGEQAILFLNRRGFSTFITCRRCHQVVTCGACAVALTYHRARAQAICHYCDRERDPPVQCPSCREPALHYFGFGTERIEDEVRRRFKGVEVRRVDSDSVEDAAALEAVLADFGAGKAQVLIGTQMVAKGLDFPRVTVVGVVSADTALSLPDFRAAERTFQLLAQVAGRAGRAALGGTTIIQTFAPDHAAIRCARTHDSFGFLDGELEHRRALGYPPFGHLAKLVLSGQDEMKTAVAAQELAAAIRSRAAAGSPDEGPGRPAILGPAPAPLAVLNGRHRRLILVKGAERGAVRKVLAVVEELEPGIPSALRLSVDVDPMSML